MSNGTGVLFTVFLVVWIIVGLLMAFVIGLFVYQIPNITKQFTEVSDNIAQPNDNMANDNVDDDGASPGRIDNDSDDVTSSGSTSQSTIDNGDGTTGSTQNQNIEVE